MNWNTPYFNLLHGKSESTKEQLFQLYQEYATTLYNTNNQEYEKFRNFDFDTHHADLLSTIFGGDKFCNMLGDISLFQADLDLPEDFLKSEYDQRIQLLTVSLHTTLNFWVNSDQSQDTKKIFMDSLAAETEELIPQSFGTEILHVIGHTYALKAQQFISQNSRGITKIFFPTKKPINVEINKNTKAALDTAALTHQILLKETVRKVALPQNNYSAKVLVLTTAWFALQAEIQTVLDTVCDNVLNDPTVPETHRAAQAFALLLMGTSLRRTFRCPINDYPLVTFWSQVAAFNPTIDKQNKRYLLRPKAQIKPFGGGSDYPDLPSYYFAGNSLVGGVGRRRLSSSTSISNSLGTSVSITGSGAGLGIGSAISSSSSSSPLDATNYTMKTTDIGNDTTKLFSKGDYNFSTTTSSSSSKFPLKDSFKNGISINNNNTSNKYDITPANSLDPTEKIPSKTSSYYISDDMSSGGRVSINDTILKK